MIYLQRVGDQSNRYSWQARADVCCRFRHWPGTALGNRPRPRASLVSMCPLVPCFHY